MLKPAVGATARETIRFAAVDLERAQAHVDRLQPHEDLLLQPYLKRVEREGELSGIFIGGALSHTVRKVPQAGDYRVQDDFGAHDERHTPCAEEAAMFRLALEAAGAVTLYARVDVLRDDAGALCLGELELVEPLLFSATRRRRPRPSRTPCSRRCVDRNGPGILRP